MPALNFDDYVHDPTVNEANNDGDISTSAGMTASRRGKGKVRPSEPYGASPIALLPLELLAHIFAHLPPRELGTCQLVCKIWNGVVGDEGSWRTAFETYFGVTPESLGRRLEVGSWRSEYITRVSLLRRWRRSRTPTVLHNPSLGALSYMHFSFPPASPLNPGIPKQRDENLLTTAPLLSLSLPLGAALHSIPFTGKLSKRPLLSTPIDHLGRALHLPLIPATSFSISPDREGSKLVWGMRDGSLRFSNSSAAPSGARGAGAGLGGAAGRGIPGGIVEQGEVRALFEAHREGCEVQLVTFSNAAGVGGGRVSKGSGIRQRVDLVASVGADGWVRIWDLNMSGRAEVEGGGAGEMGGRTPPARKVWEASWDARETLEQTGTVLAGSGPATAVGAAEERRRRVKATKVAFDAGWTGRHHGRKATLAVGRGDGKVLLWRNIDLEDEDEGSGRGGDPVVLEDKGGEQGTDGEVDCLHLDPPSSAHDAFRLLVHRAGARTFSRHTFLPSSAIGSDSTPQSTTFGHSSLVQLSALTAFAIDFDAPPPPPPTLAPSTPQSSVEARLTFPSRPFSLHRAESTASSVFSLPSLSRTGSTSSLLPPSSSVLASSPSSASTSTPSFRFGQRKYVCAGDADGRVYLWDWEAKQSEEEEDRAEVVGPSGVVQDGEMEEDGAGNATGNGAGLGKVTALEINEVGVFVGGLDGTLRLYSPLSPLPSSPLRVFRDRTAPRHPRGALAAGLIPIDEEERWLVSHIRASRDAVVAAIGGRVLAWRVDEGVKRKVIRPGAKGTARQERFKANLELQHQVRESISALSLESAARVEAHIETQRRKSEFGPPPSLGHITEEEAVAFATMLSLDEQEASMFAVDVSEENGWEEAPEEWLEDDSVVLDEDYKASQASGDGSRSTPSEAAEEDEYYASRTTSRGPSRTQSLSIPSSPFLRGLSLPISSSPISPRNHHLQNWTPVSPSLLTVGSPPFSCNPNGKVQVSPRLGPTYSQQGATFSTDQIPDMNPELWPVASSPPPVHNDGPRRTPIASAAPSPLRPISASPSPTVPSPALPLSPPLPASPFAHSPVASTPIKRGWSDVARTATTSSSPSHTESPSPSASSPTPNWPFPAISASRTPHPRPTATSLLAERLRNSEALAMEEDRQRREDREREELELAIALSLSEGGGL
ncbi:hypothetical protein JCM11641_002773 [Rhodosporidiobolus odoratus]